MSTEIGSGTFGDRVNLTPNVPRDIECGAGLLGEVLEGSNGRYLGNFDSLYVAPFGLYYPVGFTNATWYEQPGLSQEDIGAVCIDCQGTTDGIYYRQRTPGEPITCFEAGTFDLWDYSITPDRYLGGEGPRHIFDPSLYCKIPLQVLPDGKCRIFTELQFWLHEPFPWPLVPFAFCNPSSRINVVSDSSGPDGLEDCLALEIDFSGNGNEGISFVGEDGGFNGASPPQTGINNADRSTTGWTVPHESCWIETFWIKAVPDDDAFTCTGYNIITRSGMYPFPFGQTPIAGAATMTLDGTWQPWYRVWRAHYTNPLAPDLQNSMFGIFTTHQNPITLDPGCPIGRPQWARKGRVHIKQPHIVPCEVTSGISIKRPSGRGT